MSAVCALQGCGDSLEGMRADARYCCDSHRGMAHRGERLKVPGRCAHCGEQLRSGRQRYCSDSHRWAAWKARRTAPLKRLLTATTAIEAPSVPSCRCGATVTYTDVVDGDTRCFTCGRTLALGDTPDIDLDGWREVISAVGRAAA